MKKSRIIPFSFLALILSFVMYSCGPSYSEEKTAIDSMINVLNKNIEHLGLYPLELVKSKNDSFKVLYASIDTLYDFEKRDSNFTMINSFINVQKPFRRHEKKSKKLLEDINFQIHQLTTLKQDMENNTLSKEEIQKYFTIESNECEKVVQSAKTYCNMIQSQIEIYDTLSPKIKELVNVYRLKKPLKKRTK